MTKKIIWDQQKFSVGSKRLDEQHKELVSIINEMIDCIENEDNAALTRHFINFASKVQTHFTTEEEILASIKFPALPEHIAKHRYYDERISEFILKGIICCNNRLVQLLNQWWTDHILKEDMAYKGFVKNS